MAGMTLAVAATENAAGAAQAGGTLSSIAPFLPALLLAIAIVAVPYLVLNSVLAWLASNLMSFREATLGRALKLTILQLIIPVPIALAGSVAFYLVLKDRPLPGDHAELMTFVYPFLCFIAVAWVLSVAVSGIVYKVGFLRAAAFNTVLWLIEACVAFILRVGQCS